MLVSALNEAIGLKELLESIKQSCFVLIAYFIQVEIIIIKLYLIGKFVFLYGLVTIIHRKRLFS